MVTMEKNENNERKEQWKRYTVRSWHVSFSILNTHVIGYPLESVIKLWASYYLVAQIKLEGFAERLPNRTFDQMV